MSKLRYDLKCVVHFETESLRFLVRGSAFGWAAHFLIYGVYVMEKNNTCCFFGHRKIIVTERLKLILYNLIEDKYFKIGSYAVFPVLYIVNEKYFFRSL